MKTHPAALLSIWILLLGGCSSDDASANPPPQTVECYVPVVCRRDNCKGAEFMNGCRACPEGSISPTYCWPNTGPMAASAALPPVDPRDKIAVRERR